MADNSSNSAITPYSWSPSARSDDWEFQHQFKNFLTRYYIGISDLQAKGILVDQGLPWRIEKELTLRGRVLVLELKIGEKRKLLLGQIESQPVRNLDGDIVQVRFTITDDRYKPSYSAIRSSEERRLIIYNQNGEMDLLYNPARAVLFLNNTTGEPDQVGIDLWLEKLKRTLDSIYHDQRKCRKKMAIFTPSKMDGTDKKEAIEGFENDDYIFNISFDKSQIFKKGKTGKSFDSSEVSHSISGPENSKEREQLWADYRELQQLATMFNGVIISPSFKQDRQNIPETLMLSAPYRAWEAERKFIREEAYRQCETFGWIEPHWTLKYGVQQETNEQRIKKVEEEIRLLELEEKLALMKAQSKSLDSQTKKEEYKEAIVVSDERKK